MPDFPTPVSAELARHIRDEPTRLILAHTELATFAATVFALFLGVQVHSGSLASNLPAVAVSAWVAVKVTVAALRIVHASFLRNRPQLMARWQRWTIPLLAFDGAVWGAGGVMLMFAPTETWTVVAASLCGVACVATFGLQVSFRATAAYVVPIIAPLSAALVVRGDQPGLMTGTGLAIFLGLMLSTARRSDAQMRETLLLRHQTERVSGELRDALALANQHGEAKDRFLAVVSHELRTPLHGILGLTKLARSELPQAQGHLHYRLDLIDEAGRHLQRLVNDLLDISLIEAGGLHLKPEVMDLHRDLALLVATYEIRGAELGIRLRIDVDDGIGEWVVGDPDRIAQVLHNLLHNAMKFTRLGGTVRLRVDRPAADGRVRFEVTDDGPGIRLEELQLVFEAFTQGAARSGSRPQGVGLGLTISRQLARAMGGDVTCVSREGEGSVFTFSASLPTAGRPPELDPPAVSWQRSRRLAGLLVFVAEDDPVSKIISGSTALRLGLVLEEFVDGQQLLEHALVPDRRPDIILIDWDLPKVNGGRATQAIRNYEKAHGLDPIVIIGLSANAAPAYEVAAREAGMDAFLTKPCSPDDIAHAIQSQVQSIER